MVNTIHTLELISMNALPALEEVPLDGWRLRFANGYTGRGNAVYPLAPGSTDIPSRIDTCEQFYRERDLPCLFKMTNAAQPPHLDQTLDNRGYTPFNRTSVQCLNLSSAPAQADDEIISSDGPTPVWLDSFCTLRDLPARHRETFRTMLGRLTRPCRCVALMGAEGAMQACGLAVLEPPYVGLFDITTHPAHRQRGLATRLVLDLLRWGQTLGATTAYLQVMATNTPATLLYRKLGFVEAYQYWYRKRS